MKNRRTDTVTRVDVRIPNELYNQIQAIAIDHFHAKIHHRSGKPEISPTILELIKAESEPLSAEGLSDSELGRLINLSSTLIYRYRLEGKAHQGVVERLKEWEVRGDRWVKKD